MKNSSDDEDDFVSIGTALPQYDQDEVPVRKPITIQEQTVRDSKGRLRFHGAFTGGFSAGYFNTVDTEQGWTPTTFQSSRSQKAEAPVTQRPEDFMDDEDFSEYGIAPKKIATTKIFTDGKNDRKRKTDLDHIDSSLIGANVLADLVIPCRSSIGRRLLRKLGWKDGQGIGPRERRRQRQTTHDISIPAENVEVETAQKVYGCALPPGLRQGSDGGSSEDDEYGSDEMTFAPHDVSPINFDPKGNVHGLGYRGINPSTEILRGNRMQSLPVTSQKGKMGIRGQAFGVGAFEEEDDDIYGIESLSNYDREISEGDSRTQLSTFGWTAPKHRPEKASYDDLMRTKDAIAGFMRSSTTLAPKKTYPPPQIPRDFRPFHKFDSVPKTKATESERTKLNAFSRGVLLGEKPHLNSVFELVSTEDKARMEAAKLQVMPRQAEAPSSAAATTPPGDGLQVVTPSVSVESKGSRELKMAPGGSTAFVPFARDPVKQKRYEAYLDATKNKKPYVQDDSLSSHMTDWEKEREREEFAKAAHLFQPLSNMIASRFTRAKHDDDEEVNLPAEEEKSEQAKAAELKMFGKLTRERCAWHPDKLVCRRFNIADPYPESDIIGLRTVKRDKCSIFNFLTFSNDDPQNSEKKETEPTKDKDSKPMKPLAILATVDLRPTSSSSSRNETEKAETLKSASLVTQVDKPEEVATVDHSNERPPIDLFKAIFEDTDSENDSADDNVEPAPPSTDSVGNISADFQKSSQDAVVTSHAEQSFLQQIQDSEIMLPESSAMEENENIRISENLVDMNSLVVGRTDDVFGPALPPSTASPEARKETVQNTVADNGDKYRHHHKVKHKHKKHKSSSKKKHKKKTKKQKKKTRMTSSSSNGSDADYESDVDSTAEIDWKILSRLKGYIEAEKTSTGKHK